MGHELDNLESKIVDSEGRIVPRGETGELCVRGYIVMLGYYKQKEKTAEARALLIINIFAIMRIAPMPITSYLTDNVICDLTFTFYITYKSFL